MKSDNQFLLSSKLILHQKDVKIKPQLFNNSITGVKKMENMIGKYIYIYHINHFHQTYQDIGLQITSAKKMTSQVQFVKPLILNPIHMFFNKPPHFFNFFSLSHKIGFVH